MPQRDSTLSPARTALDGRRPHFSKIARISDTELRAEAHRLAVTALDAARAAAAMYARPERSARVVVGDRSKIEAGLRELGLGEVVLLDVEGRPAKQAPTRSKKNGSAERRTPADSARQAAARRR